jgi:hypothetical protein
VQAYEAAMQQHESWYSVSAATWHSIVALAMRLDMQLPPANLPSFAPPSGYCLLSAMFPGCLPRQEGQGRPRQAALSMALSMSACTLQLGHHQWVPGGDLGPLWNADLYGTPVPGKVGAFRGGAVDGFRVEVYQCASPASMLANYPACLLFRSKLLDAANLPSSRPLASLSTRLTAKQHGDMTACAHLLQPRTHGRADAAAAGAAPQDAVAAAAVTGRGRGRRRCAEGAVGSKGRRGDDAVGECRGAAPAA